MKKMFGLEVEKVVSMDDEEGLDLLYELKDQYYGEYEISEGKVGYVWEDEYKVIRVFYEDEENDVVIVYLVY